jgi:hypothetical protein
VPLKDAEIDFLSRQALEAWLENEEYFKQRCVKR